MPARHRSRQRALQTLFQSDIRRMDIRDSIHDYFRTLYTEESEEVPGPDPFMETLAVGTFAKQADLDAVIERKSENWRIERMPTVDRNILRMAAYEMIEVGTPAPVVIDEAIELARQFSTPESVSFINGVLDAIHKERMKTNPPARSA
jgi:N utilization substance protein B